MSKLASRLIGGQSSTVPFGEVYLRLDVQVLATEQAYIYKSSLPDRRADMHGTIGQPASLVFSGRRGAC
jgi:hypothetical protein